MEGTCGCSVCAMLFVCKVCKGLFSLYDGIEATGCVAFLAAGRDICSRCWYMQYISVVKPTPMK